MKHTPLVIMGGIAALALLAALLWPRPLMEQTLQGPAPSEQLYPVIIDTPSDLGTATTGKLGPDGAPMRVSCGTCHGGDEGVRDEDAERVHAGVNMDHGDVSCLSCHDQKDRDSLRLADGTTMAFTSAMTLCGQCHGPQYRDYKHGTHGGMTGYWDRTKGPQTRNHCLHCHNAHAPAIAPVRPAPMPRDRGLAKSNHGEAK